MKKTFVILIVAMAAIAMVSCKKDNTNSNDKPNYNELVVGKWDVQTYHLWIHDLTDEHPWGNDDSYSQEETWNLPDTSYAGYDAIEIYADGTLRWHMSDRMFQEGTYANPYVEADWLISGDSLTINTTKYAITKLDNETMVFEDYYKVNSYQNHHGWERTNCYTFKRVQGSN